MTLHVTLVKQTRSQYIRMKVLFAVLTAAKDLAMGSRTNAKKRKVVPAVQTVTTRLKQTSRGIVARRRILDNGGSSSAAGTPSRKSASNTPQKASIAYEVFNNAHFSDIAFPVTHRRVSALMLTTIVSR